MRDAGRAAVRSVKVGGRRWARVSRAVSQRHGGESRSSGAGARRSSERCRSYACALARKTPPTGSRAKFCVARQRWHRALASCTACSESCYVKQAGVAAGTPASSCWRSARAPPSSTTRGVRPTGAQVQQLRGMIGAALIGLVSGRSLAGTGLQALPYYETSRAVGARFERQERGDDSTRIKRLMLTDRVTRSPTTAFEPRRRSLQADRLERGDPGGRLLHLMGAARGRCSCVSSAGVRLTFAEGGWSSESGNGSRSPQGDGGGRRTWLPPSASVGAAGVLQAAGRRVGDGARRSRRRPCADAARAFAGASSACSTVASDPQVKAERAVMRPR